MNEYPKTNITVKVDDYVYRYLKILSVHEGLTMAQLISVLADEDIEQNPEFFNKHKDYITKNCRVK